jgi:hypothetical protein
MFSQKQFHAQKPDLQSESLREEIADIDGSNSMIPKTTTNTLQQRFFQNGR